MIGVSTHAVKVDCNYLKWLVAAISDCGYMHITY
jgi:hypothetical protein